MSKATEVAEANGPLRRLNSNPVKAYEIRMQLANVPGDFEVIRGTAQFDVENPGECGDIDPFIGAIPRISSNEQMELTKISDTEYVGVVYLDQIVDEDYYGRAVCRWALTEARVTLRANDDVNNTLFVAGIAAEKVRDEVTETRFFWSGYYPRARMDAFRDLGDASLEKVAADNRGRYFSIILSAREISS